MNKFYWYISKKITQGKGFKKGFSRPIVLIATGAIALGIAVMITSISIVTGFQNQVRDKVVGFGAHVQITQNSGAQSQESVPMLIDDSLVSVIRKVASVKHVQSFAIKPGILETRKDIEGAVIKGVDQTFDWGFLSEKLVSGVTLSEDSNYFRNSVVVSKIIADRLQLEVGDKTTIYFIQNQEDVKPRTFRIVGIYNSGFVEFDEQFVFVPISVMASVSKWGIEAQIRVKEDESKQNWLVEGLGFGGQGMLKYQWNIPEWRGAGPHELSKNKTIPVELIVRDQLATIPDTAWVNFQGSTDSSAPGILPIVATAGGSHSQYIGGYEVLLTDYESILNADDALTFSLPYYFRSDTILSRFPEIFSWLSTLDINVIIIIILMIFVAVINMASALLIIILEKTNLIGLFKAFGSTTTQLSGIFVAVSFRILIMGLIIGNLLGIGFCVLQREYGLVKLNAEHYYLDQVPINLNWMNVLSINAVTLLICVLCMLLPVLYVSKIDPVKAIKFD
ncbi:MAG: ABC transporter permease [Flavobacteriales bacterium]